MVANKLLQVVSDSHSDATDLADVISKDQALSAKVLKLVNSAFYGFSNKVTTINRGVVVLGYNAVKSLTLGISVFDTASSMKGEEKGFDVTAFWEHSIAVGAGARLLSRLIKYKVPEEAFIAGLLHDIGKNVLNLYIAEDFLKAVRMSAEEGIPLLKAEMKIIGVDHEMAGEYLAERWKLPYPLRMAISKHHNPPLNDKNIDQDILKLMCIVNLSNTLCKMKNIGFSGNSYIGKKDEEVLRWMNIKEGDIERFFLEIEGEVHRTKEFFGILEQAESEEDIDIASGTKGQVYIIEKENTLLSMSCLFIKNLGFDCKQILSTEDIPSLLIEKKPTIIFVNELSETEINTIKNDVAQYDKLIPVVNLPGSFDSQKLLVLIKTLEPKVDNFVAKGGEKKRILVVDDEKIVTDMLRDFFERSGFSVMTLNFAEETIVSLKKFRPHLIILDLKMPKIDGLTLVKLLHKSLNDDFFIKNTKIMILSAYLSDQIKKVLLSMGITIFMNKPVDLEELLDNVNKLLTGE